MVTRLPRLRAHSEYIAVPALALGGAGGLFALFLLALGKSPVEFAGLVWQGGFGSAFSVQNTLQRAAPLILTALAFAIPARAGLIMIGAEGALALGGLACAALGTALTGAAPAPLVLSLMALAALVTGALWAGLAGWMRAARGVNETISSLLLTYIAIAILNSCVEGPLRDLANPNRPSTRPLGEALMIGKIAGTQVHWGFAAGVFLCIALWLLTTRSTFGFAARVTGANPRAARTQGLNVSRIILLSAMIGGACAGLAGFFEVAAVQGSANGGLIAGYGFTGVLVSFLARHNPPAIPAVAILFGGLAASGGLIQRRMDLPDAAVLVLQGVIFLALLAAETLYGRFAFFKPAAERRA